jgi:hypothetical protein
MPRGLPGVRLQDVQSPEDGHDVHAHSIDGVQAQIARRFVTAKK